MLQGLYPRVSAFPASAWVWPHINPQTEWADRMTDSILVVPAFLDKLEALRTALGHPLIISSGYRSPEHNVLVSTTGETGPHTTGRAVDIKIYGERAFRMVTMAADLGFTGMGLSQKGEHAHRFVHLDDLAAPDYPRPMIWSY